MKALIMLAIIVAAVLVVAVVGYAASPEKCRTVTRDAYFGAPAASTRSCEKEWPWG